MGGGRSLTPTEAENVRAALRELARAHERQQDLADALKVKQQTVSAILGGRANPGFALARGVAHLLGRPIDVVLGSARPASATTWRDLPGAVEAFNDARQQFPGVSADAWEWVASLSGAPPPSLAPAFLWTLATAYSNAPRPVATTSPPPFAPQTALPARPDTPHRSHRA